MRNRRGCARRREVQRRGRRIIFWLIGFYWTAQFLGSFVLDYVWPNPRFPYRFQMYANLRAQRHTPEIVFLGSSRFGGDVNCSVLDAELQRRLDHDAPRTFNAALAAGDPVVFERVAHDLFRDGNWPRLLVVEISPETVNQSDNWLYQHALNFLDWRDVPEALPALCRNGKIMYLFRGRCLPLYVHRYHICKQAVATLDSLVRPNQKRRPAAALQSSVPATDPEPPAIRPGVWATIQDGYETARRAVQNYSPGGLTRERLERLLDRCSAAGVHVLLVGVPVSSPYRKAYTPEVNEAFLGYVHQLTETYGCHFVDWRDRLSDRCFMDGHHANAAGGVIFSRQLARSVLAPLWRELSETEMNPNTSDRMLWQVSHK